MKRGMTTVRNFDHFGDVIRRHLSNAYDKKVSTRSGLSMAPLPNEVGRTIRQVTEEVAWSCKFVQ